VQLLGLRLHEGGVVVEIVDRHARRPLARARRGVDGVARLPRGALVDVLAVVLQHLREEGEEGVGDEARVPARVAVARALEALECAEEKVAVRPARKVRSERTGEQ
jgi:hypothetical protein